ncbi:hypothetical protein BX666DRAFT_1988094 [Dichotomocladium elegans]|nr:hypothetical protein BX666DRAFT_1988094 [Dichotomocladium elegans]
MRGSRRNTGPQVTEMPASVTIVNESTPLLAKNAIQHNAPVPTDARVFSLNQDPAIRKKELLGLVLLVLSALAFTLGAFFVKKIGHAVPLLEIVFSRAIVQLAFSLLSCSVLRMNPFGDKSAVRPWLLLRALVIALGLVLFFYSIIELSLTEATVLFFLGPTFTALIAAIVFHDTFTTFDSFCSVLCVVGVILISQPSGLFGMSTADGALDDRHRAIASASALGGAFMSAIGYVTVRKVGKGIHFMVHVFYTGIVASLVCLVGLFLLQHEIPFLHVRHTPAEWMQMGLVGLLAFIGQCLLHQGVKQAPSGPGLVMRMNDVFFAFLVGYFFLDESLNLYSILGSAVIVGMTTALGVHRWQQYAASRRLQRRQSRQRIHSHRST